MAAPFAVVLVAPASADEAEQAVALAGGTLAAQYDWEGATAAGDLHGRPVLAIEAGAEPPAEELTRLAVLAEARGLEVVVSFDEPAIDVVAATLMSPHAQLLCNPTLAERVAALALAGRRAGGEAAAVVRETDAERLRRLDDEVARLAALLAQLTAAPDTSTGGDGGVGDRRMRFGVEPAVAIADDPQAIRRAIRARRLRDGFFPDGLFEEPAWDMLLDLYAAGLEGGRVSVSSLCIAAAVAPTTALRWIGRMTDLGLFTRDPDPADRRRAFVALSDPARDGMRQYLASLRRAGLALA